MKNSYLILIAFIILSGCTTSRHINNGNAMLSQQNYERAAREYSIALRNSPNNSKAFSGLQRASDLYVSNQLIKFNELFNNREYVKAQETMEAVLDFNETYSRFGVKSEIPRSDMTKYQNIANAVAEYYYRHGMRELNNRNFSSAISNFKKTQESDPNYKNVRELLQQAERGEKMVNAERFYQSGMRNYQAKNYRAAFKDMERCLQQVSGYKNAAAVQSSALEKGKVRVGVFDFGNETRVFGVQGTLTSYLISDIVNTRNPFIEVVDRQNLERLLNEIRFSYSGSADLSSVVRAGKMLGLNYVVVGRVTNVIEEGGQILPRQVNAYELYYVTVEGEQQPRGRPVTFTLFEGSSKVTFEAQYQIVSVETGRIVKSNIVSAHDSDAISYARYSGGDYRLLYLTDPGVVADTKGVLGAITSILVTASTVNQSLFTARNNLKTPSEMQASIIRNIGRQMAGEITSHFD